MKKTVLITGGSRGIGRAIAKALAQDPYHIVIGYEKEKEAAENVVEYIRLTNSDVMAIQGDLRKTEDVERIFDEIEARFGMVDILINNAGIAKGGLIQDLSEEEWLDVFNVNVHGMFRTIRRAAPKMISKKEGIIVNISSIWGMVGASMESNYAASKGAVIALTKSMASELGYSGIRVNAVAPGGVETEMLAPLPEEAIEAFTHEVPMGRLASPEEIAGVVRFLISEEASYMQGQVLSPNGGFVL